MTILSRRLPLLMLAAALGPAVAHAQQPASYDLPATPGTVAYGYYWSQATPALRIRSGDRVTVHGMITNTPQGLMRAGVDSARIQQSLRDIVRDVTGARRGPGGHILTGPIYVEGADSGDVLEVRFLSLHPDIDYAYNSFSTRSGFIPEDFTTGKTRIIPLDTIRNVAHFADGIDIPLRPFFGSVGVAPPAAMGRVNSAPPGIYAGNLDNKELVAGTTLYIPVWTPGALLEIGDGHAGMGNGEVDITAMETSLRGTVQIIVRKDMHLKWPRAETPTHWITMGIDSNLVTAAKNAVREAIDFLVTERHMTREDAYMLCSVAVDFDITELVDGTVGVHAMIPKNIFAASGGRKGGQ
ncbi:MAG TPA: acetamidase/formamidase family protein [Gemmatimonadales bacterium]|jgi:acetamidase/formamidase|nr:acetamidase/formamidase family protein [Gemmatimonadales bacterium]